MDAQIHRWTGCIEKDGWMEEGMNCKMNTECWSIPFLLRHILLTSLWYQDHHLPKILYSILHGSCKEIYIHIIIIIMYNYSTLPCAAIYAFCLSYPCRKYRKKWWHKNNYVINMIIVLVGNYNYVIMHYACDHY